MVGKARASRPGSQLELALDRVVGRRDPGVAVELGTGSPTRVRGLVSGEGRPLICAMDSDPRRLRTAPVASTALSVRIVRIAGDAYRLPFRPACVDLILWRKLFCVLRDPRRALEGILRVVRPGGQVVAIEPAGAQQFHVPDDERFAALSRRLNRAFRRGWRERGADQDIGLRMPELFLKAGLVEVAVEAAVDAHLVSDHRRSPDGVLRQLRTESSPLPEPTRRLLEAGGFPGADLEEHRERAEARLRRNAIAEGDPDANAASYLRIMSPLVVTRAVRPG